MSTVNRAATVTIASGQTVSNSIDLGEFAIVGLITPATITSTAITFQSSPDNSTFTQIVKVDGTVYTLSSVVASKTIAIPPADLACVRWCKVVGGSAEGADRDIILMLRAV